MILAYYSPKDNTFHSKYYTDREECKKDFNILKKAKVLFSYSNAGLGFYNVAEYGLKHGKETDLSELPILIANKFEEIISEDNSRDYGGKRELWYNVYKSKYWYSLSVDLGEDMFENEVVNEYFITKDGKSLISR